MITPQLRQFIDSINNRYRDSNKRLEYQYGAGHKATLTVTTDTLVLNSDNVLLVKTLGKLLQKILSGDAKDVVDKLDE